MKATIGEPMSIQVHATMERALQFTNRSILKPVQTSITRAILKGGTKAVFKAGAKAGAKATFKLGYRAATNGTIVGAVGGIAVGVNILLEGPLFARGLYKLHRKKKFDLISDTEYNRGIIQQSFTTVNTIIGGVCGAIVGTVAIPVPVLGAAVGGMVGSVVGQGVGYGEGWLVSQLVHNKILTLPIVIQLNYTSM